MRITIAASDGGDGKGKSGKEEEAGKSRSKKP
jgi:hypothetical protein